MLKNWLLNRNIKNQNKNRKLRIDTKRQLAKSKIFNQKVLVLFDFFS